MMLDNMVFHTEEGYPSDLPEDRAVTHMGYYWSWVVRRNLHHSQWDEVAKDEIIALKNYSMSGVQFIMQMMDGGLEDIDFNEEGLRFSLYYYDDEEEGYGRFMEDYVQTLDTPSLPSFYHVAINQENQQLLDDVFDTALNSWRKTLKPTAAG